MRILIGVILILVIGGIIAASFLIYPSTLNSAELTQVKSTCAECHKVPVIQSEESFTAAHSTLACAVCHTGEIAGSTTGSTLGEVDFNSCISCHSFPNYTGAAAVHDAHATTACITCHRDAAGLNTATSAQNTLRLAGIILAGLLVVGIVLNFTIAKLRLKNDRITNGK